MFHFLHLCKSIQLLHKGSLSTSTWTTDEFFSRRLLSRGDLVNTCEHITKERTDDVQALMRKIVGKLPTEVTVI